MNHIIYLAAGNSRRFEGNKLLYSLNKKPLYRYGYELAGEVAKSIPDTTFTVVTQYEEIFSELQKEGVHVVFSKESHLGASYTIKAGLKSLGTVDPDDYLLFLVADQPWLKKESVLRLLTEAKTGVKTARLVYGGRMGNPVLFKGELFSELMGLSADEGGRTILKRNPPVLVEASCERELFDIDYREDVNNGTEIIL